MVKESCVCVIDDTDYGRNEDYGAGTPRLELQKETVQMIMGSKLRSDPENDFGLVRTAGGTTNVTVGLVRDEHRMAIELNKIDLNAGTPKTVASFVRGIDTARLCLKNRANRGNKCRVIVYVGSLAKESLEEYLDLAKVCRKEKIYVDVISFGAEEVPQNAEKLNAFVQALNGKDGTESHLVTISYPSNFMEAFRNSPIMQGEDGQPLAEGGADADPELQEILRESLRNFHAEEERRQAAAAGMDTSTMGIPALPPPTANVDAMTEDEQLELALKLSIEQAGAAAEAMETDAAGSEPTTAAAPQAAAASEAPQFDPAELERIVEGLPGADKNDPQIQQALSASRQSKPKASKPGDPGSEPKSDSSKKS